MKRVYKQFKLPFRSTSPKIKKFPLQKESTTFLKKKSTIKSPEKIRWNTEAGNIIIPKQPSNKNLDKSDKNDRNEKKMK